MAENEPTGDQAQPDEAAPASPPAGTDQGTRDLEQRIRGLDAKVTTLQKERDAALAKAADLESGKINADEALRAQLAQRDAELAELRQTAAALPRMQKFPKLAKDMDPKELAALSEETLANLEAQLTAAEASSSAPVVPKPTPVPANAPDADGPAVPEGREGIVRKLGSLLDSGNWSDFN